MVAQVGEIIHDKTRRNKDQICSLSIPVICSFFAFRLNESQIPNKFKSKIRRKTSIVNLCISRNPKHTNSSVHMRSVRHLKTKQKRLHSQCESFQLLDEMESFVKSIVRSNVMRMNSKRILLSVLLTAPHQINQFSVLISQFAFHMKFVEWSFSYNFMQNEIAISHVPGVFQSECMIVDGPERKSRRENHFVLFRCAYIQSGSPRIVSHVCLSIVSCPSPCPPMTGNLWARRHFRLWYKLCPVSLSLYFCCRTTCCDNPVGFCFYFFC